jgi:hypothetical protein
VRTPSLSAVRITRHAISPRLAIRILAKGGFIDPANQTLPAKLAVRAQPYQFESIVVRLSVDQDEVRAYMAIAAVLPTTFQGMVKSMSWQRFVVRELGQYVGEFAVEQLGVATGLFTTIILLELR